MRIENHLQIQFHTPVDDLFHASHPFAVNRHGGHDPLREAAILQEYGQHPDPAFLTAASISLVVFGFPHAAHSFEIGDENVYPFTVHCHPSRHLHFPKELPDSAHFYFFRPGLCIFVHACGISRYVQSLCGNIIHTSKCK